MNSNDNEDKDFRRSLPIEELKRDETQYPESKGTCPEKKLILDVSHVSPMKRKSKSCFEIKPKLSIDNIEQESDEILTECSNIRDAVLAADNSKKFEKHLNTVNLPDKRNEAIKESINKSDHFTTNKKNILTSKEADSEIQIGTSSTCSSVFDESDIKQERTDYVQMKVRTDEIVTNSLNTQDAALHINPSEKLEKHISNTVESINTTEVSIEKDAAINQTKHTATKRKITKFTDKTDSPDTNKSEVCNINKSWEQVPSEEEIRGIIFERTRFISLSEDLENKLEFVQSQKQNRESTSHQTLSLISTDLESENDILPKALKSKDLNVEMKSSDNFPEETLKSDETEHTKIEETKIDPGKKLMLDTPVRSPVKRKSESYFEMKPKCSTDNVGGKSDESLIRLGHEIPTENEIELSLKESKLIEMLQNALKEEGIDVKNLSLSELNQLLIDLKFFISQDPSYYPKNVGQSERFDLLDELAAHVMSTVTLSCTSESDSCLPLFTEAGRPLLPLSCQGACALSNEPIYRTPDGKVFQPLFLEAGQPILSEAGQPLFSETGQPLFPESGLATRVISTDILSCTSEAESFRSPTPEAGRSLFPEANQAARDVSTDTLSCTPEDGPFHPPIPEAWKSLFREHVHCRQIPEHVHSQQIPEHVHSQQIPEHVHHRQIPAHVYRQQLPEHILRPQLPEHVLRPQLPEHVLRPQLPEHVLRPQLPEHIQGREILEHVLRRQIPDHVLGREILENVQPQFPEAGPAASFISFDTLVCSLEDEPYQPLFAETGKSQFPQASLGACDISTDTLDRTSEAGLAGRIISKDTISCTSEDEPFQLPTPDPGTSLIPEKGRFLFPEVGVATCVISTHALSCTSGDEPFNPLVLETGEPALISTDTLSCTSEAVSLQPPVSEAESFRPPTSEAGPSLVLAAEQAARVISTNTLSRTPQTGPSRTIR